MKPKFEVGDVVVTKENILDEGEVFEIKSIVPKSSVLGNKAKHYYYFDNTIWCIPESYLKKPTKQEIKDIVADEL